jgi:hypothetical protein
MLIVALLIGAILITAAIRNSQGALFSALATDAPDYVIWAAALFAVGAIGFIPGLKASSRLLMGLVITVLVLNNYKAIIAGFQSAASGAEQTGASNATSQSSSSQSAGSQSSGASSSTPTSSYNALSAALNDASSAELQAGVS